VISGESFCLQAPCKLAAGFLEEPSDLVFGETCPFRNGAASIATTVTFDDFAFLVIEGGCSGLVSDALLQSIHQPTVLSELFGVRPGALEIEQAGSGVGGLWPGDRPLLSPLISCSRSDSVAQDSLGDPSNVRKKKASGGVELSQIEHQP
jgi:hypothetical protein